jgi:hypothetical protein
MLRAVTVGMLLASQCLLAEAASSEATIGRWSIVPLSNTPVRDKDQVLFFAWRIDTVTGSVEVCTFDPGGWKSPASLGGVANITLECTAPVPAVPAN